MELQVVAETVSENELRARTVNRRDFLRFASAFSAGIALSRTATSAKEIALTDTSLNLDLQTPDSKMLENLRQKIINYFRVESNPHNGLVADKTQPGCFQVLRPLEWDSVATLSVWSEAYYLERRWWKGF